ncbi:MAG: ferredoxin-NAD reductase [Betaproteobacteria bacterium RIFCSPLOWO2_02_FULL_66_14]|nr:MAG: ferredoxin-NAD reductase [Betaproteobacteria bacterium RIFCSPLOWO2_02_FULL_66_14]
MINFIHRFGQWFFLRVEGVFNLAFGERLNPLYYLGAISYWLMWVVVASGLYLYIFFKTGVAEAHASVESLTHGQWYLGGVMRSLHRYASDGVVLTMALHLARHWTFDRYRGFHWFSWITGVVLLWMVYAAGINGYMLPWDRVAQFVVVATAEWFDVLPVFNGTLIRNFIFPEAVNDRLFSLLSFIHLGIPLATLAVLWIHTHRVPHARTTPPWPIVATLTASLVVLSLVKPALSQGQADLSRAITTIEFDWFLLPVYALLYRWTPLEVWALVAGATVVFALAPWLPPRKRSGPREGFHLLVRPDNRILAAREGETLLDAGLRAEVPFPFECRSGGCGKCKAMLAYGKVDFGMYQAAMLTDAERAGGKLLLCCATPLSDVEIEYQPLAAPGNIAPRVWSAGVESLERLSHDVMRVILRLDAGARIEFYAGQYINVLLPDGEKRSFSFATAPQVGDRIELQIRRIEGGKYTTHVFEQMKAGDVVRFEGPLGSFFLREDSEKPIIFVAGSTGFAPVKSMVEYAFARGLKREMILYWGVRTLQDLYLPDLPRQWEREHASFRFVPVLSDPAPEDHWEGRTGLVHEAILADFPNLSTYQVYACGSAGMVEAAYPAFQAHGLSQDDCFSDAFRLAPKIRTESIELAKLGGKT